MLEILFPLPAIILKEMTAASGASADMMETSPAQMSFRRGLQFTQNLERFPSEMINNKERTL